jgi:hypothetical protein
MPAAFTGGTALHGGLLFPEMSLTLILENVANDP